MTHLRRYPIDATSARILRLRKRLTGRLASDGGILTEVRTRRGRRLRNKREHSPVDRVFAIRRCRVFNGSPLAVYCLSFTDKAIRRDVPEMTARRDDDDWTSDLASEDARLRDDAVRDLRDMLLRGLSRSLSNHGRVDDAFLEDAVQEASMKILAKLGDFQSRSKFRTWAVTIAVRTAVSKMRKREWHNVSLESVTSGAEFDLQLDVDTSETVDQTNSRSEMLSKLKELIDGELTDRQWTALTAELAGMPLPQIAERLGSNTNSLYKLLHDARKKLRRGLEAAGFTIDDVRKAWA